MTTTLHGKHSMGPRLKQVELVLCTTTSSSLSQKPAFIFDLMYSATAEEKNLLKLVQPQNSLVLNTQESIQTLYIKIFTSATRAGLQPVFPLDL